MKVRPVYTVVIVLVITVLAAFFVYPAFYDKQYNFQKWRLGLDLVGGSHLVYEVDLKDVSPSEHKVVVEGLRDVIEKRVNLFGVSEPQVYISTSGNTYRLIVELAGIKDVKEAIKQIGATPFLYFAEVVPLPKEAIEGKFNPDNPPFLYRPTELTGRYIAGAKVNFNSTTNAPFISLTFNKEGGEIFAKLTEKFVGQPLAIFLDNTLVSAPVVQEKITGGQAQITGKFSLQEAREMVKRFNAGALPAPIKLVNQQTVGAFLGHDSLQKTIYAGILGTALVIAFMLLYYHALGLVASIALLIYTIITLAIFKLFGVTMSLAGIAGFILSIGIAVDANILIFERYKEELKRGLAKFTAIQEGFRRAWPSIRDSNITTIITSLVLYYLTTGFVKGFALTLLVGVIASMFSAITVSRALLLTFIRSKQSPN